MKDAQGHGSNSRGAGPSRSGQYNAVAGPDIARAVGQRAQDDPGEPAQQIAGMASGGQPVASNAHAAAVLAQGHPKSGGSPQMQASLGTDNEPVASRQKWSPDPSQSKSSHPASGAKRF